MDGDLDGIDEADGHIISFKESQTVAVDVMKAFAQTAVVPVMFRRGGVDVATEATAFCIGALESGEAISSRLHMSSTA